MLKVPHHGSRYQDLDWLLGLGARVALVSAGADNDYGHPAADDARRRSRAAGAEVLRTDLDGDLAVAVRGRWRAARVATVPARVRRPWQVLAQPTSSAGSPW